MVLLAGDLTDTGQPEEARVLARELSMLRAPGVAVLGNHDYESGHQEEVSHILSDSGITILDGEACEVHGIGIAGVKGFAGGFGTAALGPWGEPMIKQFVHEAVNEALKLEASLARLRSSRQIVLLHYSPFGRPSKASPRDLSLRRFEPSRGTDQPLPGFPRHTRTCASRSPRRPYKNDVPVYNVSLPLLNRTFPGRAPFLMLEVVVDG